MNFSGSSGIVVKRNSEIFERFFDNAIDPFPTIALLSWGMGQWPEGRTRTSNLSLKKLSLLRRVEGQPSEWTGQDLLLGWFLLPGSVQGQQQAREGLVLRHRQQASFVTSVLKWDTDKREGEAGSHVT